MIPLSDDNRQRRIIPYVNYALILINVLVYLYGLTLNQSALDTFQASCALTPVDITSGHSEPGGPCNVYVTPFTAMFMHAGFLHIAGNMLYLWIFGDNVEDALGHVGYLIFYLLCGLIASATQVAFSLGSSVPELGASGAIAGVLGAYAVLYPHARVNALLILGIFFTVTRLSALVVIGLWFVLQFVQALASLGQQANGGVAVWAHVGGFVAGAILVLLFRHPTRQYVGYNWQ
jgi:membrane associated rhomboid family serine protease